MNTRNGTPTNACIARPRADPSQRPLLAWVQKHHLAATQNQPEAINLSTVGSKI